MNNLQDARAYNGVDSSYLSSHDIQTTAVCIKKGWQEVFSTDPSRIWMTDEKDGVISIYTPQFIYLADIKAEGSKSNVTYYHNGDRFWGTKEKLTSAIKRCL
ncbi:MAG: hypothetical protein PW844_17085 [Pantoea sp.]|uniref:hypothetical protein n=1 Tax=Pantoea sp. TaxID=69393 RepID=UPI0023936C1C|nr:hypothetical protein [Pantoea sp.]MDE1188182.1 hypothetical protein [Pantoea sp.]